MVSEIKIDGDAIIVSVGKYSMIGGSGGSRDGRFAPGSKVHRVDNIFGGQSRMPATVLYVSPDGMKVVVRYGCYRELGDGTVECKGLAPSYGGENDAMFKYVKKLDTWYQCGCPNRGKDVKRVVCVLLNGWKGGIPSAANE